MWVTVDDTMLIHLLCKDFKQCLSDPLGRHTELQETLDIVDLDAVNKLHGEDLFCR